MGKKILFAVALHNHQPVGNFNHVFEESWAKCYEPFLGVLEEFSTLRLSLHYSGPLLDWLGENKRDFLERLKALVDSGRVELIGGAYYEPILPLLPSPDRLGQIAMQREYTKKTFGIDPEGLWLAERVWEQALVRDLVEAGVKYTLVDDSHFKFAGVRSESITGRYVTEDRGRFLTVFPMDEKLRYYIPFRNPEETIQYLGKLATEDGDRLMVYADDGEKFGSWPQTYKHIYEDGWLKRFLTMLTENGDWIETVTLSEAMKRLPAVGKVYIPDASYREMMAWALPPETHEELEDLEKDLESSGLFERSRFFVKGGTWRNFQARYPEAAEMYGKMLAVSRMVADMPRRAKGRREATRLLYQAQCNCPYWHGVFGGLYLPHLRAAVYERLIKAETIARGSKAGDNRIIVENGDRNIDSHDEVTIDTGSVRIGLKPADGGHLFEFDLVEKAYNLLATLTRRRESYHRAVLANPSKSASDVASIHEAVRLKDPEVRQKIVYDWYKKESLIDHFFAPGTELKALSKCRFKEQGDFVNMPYEHEIEEGDGQIAVKMTRRGGLWLDAAKRAVVVEKRVMLKAGKSDMNVGYTVTNESEDELELDFGVEFNFALLGGNAPDRYYLAGSRRDNLGNLSTPVDLAPCSAFAAVDEWKGVEWWLQFSREACVWAFPVQTASMSEYGVELVYQCSSIVPHWRFSLAAGSAWSTDIDLTPRER
ncbi:MAG: alpha-amylase/4-alpha-glucanotransferase domain-containing protein [Planctomycetota bacterium]|jgi:alpha-amylase